MEIPLLKDLVVIFGLSIVVLLICHRLKLPTIVGFLITGVLAGPHGLGLVKAVDEVKTLAELGIALLLFTVGLEFSIKKILEYKRYFLIAGPIQVLLTIAGGILAGQLFDRPMNESIFLGFLISLSSTAIVMRMMQERGESDSPHGKLSLGILIFQDVVAILMMLFVPILAGSDQQFDGTVLYLLGKGALILAVTFFSAYQLVPLLLYYVARTRSRELFLMSVLAICFAVAWITASIGLSLALGAFLAGIIISESEYRHQAMGDIIPFQDIFTSFFFVSIGMLLDLNFFMEYPISIVILTFGIFILKSFVVAVTALFLKLPIRTSVLSGMALSQVGEFSFVLAMSGISYHIGNEYLMGLFLAVSVLTMGLTPTLIALSPFVANLIIKLPLPLRIKSGMDNNEFNTKINCNNHAIIIGYGFSGRNLSRSCKEALVPYTIIDMNPETVSQEKLKGEPIYYGDATRDHVLIHANIRDAKVIAIVVNDPIGAMHVVERARSLNPSIYIVVRTRYLQEMRILFQLGADDVIPDELGSSVEIFTRVLTKYKIPSDHIEQLVTVLRTEGYEMIRPRYSETTLFSDLNENLNENLNDIAVKTLVVGKKSPFVDHSLIQTEMRKKYGLTVLVIKRENDVIYNVDPETILKTGDKVVVVGDKQHLTAAYKLFS